jgi:hypothetical protein
LETTLHSVHPRCIIVKRFHEWRLKTG